MHYYQHNIADFNNATRHLTRVERSLYRDMIEMYYDKEQPLPLDENQLFRRVLAITDEEKQAVKNVLADFFVLSDDGWRHERCDAEIEAYHAKQEQQSRAGKASAAKRGNRKTTTDEPTNNQQSTNVERPLNDCSTTDEPTNNHKPITNNHIHPHKNHEDVGDKSPRATKRFIKPSVDELTEYMKTIFADPKVAIVEADKFFNFYSANGWVVGRAKANMKDWKAACRNWRSNWDGINQARASPTPSKHTGFNERDYSAGIRADGSF